MSHPEDPGNGLGLCISKHMVQLMGGEIGVVSNGDSGQGSLFYFVIPLLVKFKEDSVKGLQEEEFRKKRGNDGLVSGSEEDSDSMNVQKKKYKAE
jgi:hypothetical protein